MFETNQFKLPLLQASQAQKHVTVNEAIARLDALAQLRLESLTQTNPPATATDGLCYWVPTGATADWQGVENKIAVFSNGGWVFLGVKDGWRAWVVDLASEMQFAGGTWQNLAAGGSGSSAGVQGALGSSVETKLLEFEHDISESGANSTSEEIPANSIVNLVSFRVSEEIVTDGATTWRLGISNSATRYGSGYGLSLNTSGFGGANKTTFFYPNAKSLYLSVTSGSFVSGKIIFSVFYDQYELPNAI